MGGVNDNDIQPSVFLSLFWLKNLFFELFRREAANIFELKNWAKIAAEGGENFWAKKLSFFEEILKILRFWAKKLSFFEDFLRIVCFELKNWAF